MALQKKTILELGKIIEEEYGLKIQGKDLEQFASSLVGYFDLMVKFNIRKSSNLPY